MHTTFTAAARMSSSGAVAGRAGGKTRAAGEGAASPGSEPLPIPEDIPDTGVYVDPDDVDGVAPQPPEPPQPKTGLDETVEEVVERAEDLVDGVAPL